MDVNKQDSAIWSEYDSAANWCAARGLSGATGDPLPTMTSSEVLWLIQNDEDAFRERVRAYAYARAAAETERRAR